MPGPSHFNWAYRTMLHATSATSPSRSRSRVPGRIIVAHSTPRGSFVELVPDFVVARTSLADLQSLGEPDERPDGARDLAKLRESDPLLVVDGNLDDAVAALDGPEERVDRNRVPFAVEREGAGQGRAVAAHAAVKVGHFRAGGRACQKGEGFVRQVVGQRHRFGARARARRVHDVDPALQDL